MDLNSLQQFLPLILIFVIMYFFMIRPQQKKQKAANEMRKNIKRGDKVTTNGGIVGKVVKIKDDVITIETGKDKVQLDVLRFALTVTQASSGSAPAPAAQSRKPAVREEEPDEKEEIYEEYTDDPRDGDYEEYDLDEPDQKNNKK